MGGGRAAFDVFGVEDADIEGLDKNSMTPLEYRATHDNVTFTSSAWGEGTVTVQRKVRGSRALQGSFTVTFQDKTIAVQF